MARVALVTGGQRGIGAAISEIWLTLDQAGTWLFGIYGGAAGYLSYGGEMDVAIAIRTGVIKDGTLYVQSGGGVVYDSDPEAEFMECVHKSRAMVRAAEGAGRFVRGNG